jgi:endonuclease-8
MHVFCGVSVHTPLRESACSEDGPVPEGDTVHLTARRLDAALSGQTLTDTDFRVPALATIRLAGRGVLATVARGKHLLTRFDDGRTLHSHLRMEGAWRIGPAGAPPRGGPAHEIRAILRTAERVAVGYRLGVLELLPTAQESRAVGHLGPDLLGPDWDLERALAGLRRLPDRAIGEALLDQTALAGIGNLYTCESLYVSGTCPWTAVAAVPDLARLVTLARSMMLANRDRWEQVSTGSLRRGERHWVFERAGQPCRRCGTRVRTARQGAAPRDRVTYWCPRCQPDAG